MAVAVATTASSKPKWIGLELNGKSHITITWLGNRTPDELKRIEEDVEAVKKLMPVTVVLTDYNTYGKPEDIKKGKGITIRKAVIEEKEAYEALQSLHRKWYFPNPGEAEERKLRQSYHVTVGKVTREEIDGYTRFVCTAGDLFIK